MELVSCLFAHAGRKGKANTGELMNKISLYALLLFIGAFGMVIGGASSNIWVVAGLSAVNALYIFMAVEFIKYWENTRVFLAIEGHNEYLNDLEAKIKLKEELIDATFDYLWTYNVIDRRLYQPAFAKVIQQRLSRDWDEYYKKVGQPSLPFKEYYDTKSCL
jgi:hypothetical protein